MYQTKKQTQFRTWKSSKHWLFACQLLPIAVLGFGVFDIPLEASAHLVHADDRSSLDLHRYPTIADPIYLPGTPSDPSRWEQFITSGSFSDKIFSFSPKQDHLNQTIWYQHAFDMSAPFSFTAKTQSLDGAKWVNNIYRFSAYLGFVFTPLESWQANRATPREFAIQGLPNSIFLGREHRANPDGNPNGMGAMIKTTDESGNYQSTTLAPGSDTYPSGFYDLWEDVSISWQNASPVSYTLHGQQYYKGTLTLHVGSYQVSQEVIMPQKVAFGATSESELYFCANKVDFANAQMIDGKPLPAQYTIGHKNRLDNTDLIQDATEPAYTGDSFSVVSKAARYQLTPEAIPGYHLSRDDQQMPPMQIQGYGPWFNSPESELNRYDIYYDPDYQEILFQNSKNGTILQQVSGYTNKMLDTPATYQTPDGYYLNLLELDSRLTASLASDKRQLSLLTGQFDATPNGEGATDNQPQYVKLDLLPSVQTLEVHYNYPDGSQQVLRVMGRTGIPFPIVPIDQRAGYTPVVNGQEGINELYAVPSDTTNNGNASVDAQPQVYTVSYKAQSQTIDFVVTGDIPDTWQDGQVLAAISGETDSAIDPELTDQDLQVQGKASQYYDYYILGPHGERYNKLSDFITSNPKYTASNAGTYQIVFVFDRAESEFDSDQLFDSLQLSDDHYDSESLILSDDRFDSESNFTSDAYFDSQSANTSDSIFDSESAFTSDAYFDSESAVISESNFDSESNFTSDAYFDSQSAVLSDSSFDSESNFTSDAVFDSESANVSDSVFDSESNLTSDAYFDSESNFTSDAYFDSESAVLSDSSLDSESNFTSDAYFDSESAVLSDSSFDSESNFTSDTYFDSLSAHASDLVFDSGSNFASDTYFDSLSANVSDSVFDSESTFTSDTYFDSLSAVISNSNFDSESAFTSDAYFDSESANTSDSDYWYYSLVDENSDASSDASSLSDASSDSLSDSFSSHISDSLYDSSSLLYDLDLTSDSLSESELLFEEWADSHYDPNTGTSATPLNPGANLPDLGEKNSSSMPIISAISSLFAYLILKKKKRY